MRDRPVSECNSRLRNPWLGRTPMPTIHSRATLAPKSQYFPHAAASGRPETRLPKTRRAQDRTIGLIRPPRAVHQVKHLSLILNRRIKGARTIGRRYARGIQTIPRILPSISVRIEALSVTRTERVEPTFQFQTMDTGRGFRVSPSGLSCGWSKKKFAKQLLQTNSRHSQRRSNSGASTPSHTTRHIRQIILLGAMCATPAAPECPPSVKLLSNFGTARFTLRRAQKHSKQPSV